MQFLKIKEIGSGGMGKVYRAFSPEHGRQVTLKTLHPVLSSDPLYQARLKKEGEILVRLSHPNIVPFIGYETVKIDTPRTCLVMEFIDGMNLQEKMNQKGSMTFEEVVPFFFQLCEALGYLHQNRTLHLDLKPENILLDREGRLFLTDFGIASIQGSLEKTSPMIDPLGSLSYTAPEQIKGEECDGRSDLYSLGMILYALLNGKGYFSGMEKKRVWGELVYETKPFYLTFPDGVPLFFQNMIRRMTAKTPEGRYPGIRPVLAEFHQVYSKPMIPLNLRPLASAPFSGKGRRGFSEKTLILASGMIVGLIAFLIWKSGDPVLQPEAAPLPLKSFSSSPHPSQLNPIPSPEIKEPIIEIASLTREKGIEPKEGERLLKTLSDADLEKFLFNFKSGIENKNLETLKKEIFFSPDNISYFQELFQSDSRLEAQFLQIKQEGGTVKVHYRIIPASSAAVREGLLLFRDNAWKLTPPL